LFQIRFLFTVFLTLALLASGCSQLPVSRETRTPTVSDTSQPATQAAETTAIQPQETAAAPRPVASASQQRIIEIGTGNYIAEAGKKPEQITENAEGDITLNFQDTDLREFIKVILSDVLGVNYFIDPDVGGKVTIETPKPITRDQVFPLLEQTLASNGASIISSAGMYHVLPVADAGKGNLTPATITNGTRDGYSIRIIPLRYVAAQEMQKILEPYMSDSNNLRIDSKRNLVIVNGTSQELDLIQDTINIFDVDWLRGMSMGLYPLTYVDPKTLKGELDTIIGAMDTGEGKELLGGLVRVVPVDRLNSILLIGSTPSALREVEIWLYRLDKPGEKVGKRLYVYNVQNAKALDLADILGRVFTGTGEKDKTQARAELAPGLKPVDIGNTSNPTAATAPATTGTGAGVTLPSNDSIEIIADDVRNALVVLATPQDYTMVEAAIKKLDVVPLQVLIEASILEVTLRGDLSYGVEWYFKNNHVIGDNKDGSGQLDMGTSLIRPLTPGFSYVIGTSATDIRLALNALQNESEVNVLSSPSLMVLDNQTATINVGDEIPVPSRQSVSNLDPNAPTVNEIQYRKTGVTLAVTPRVNSGGLVTMEVKQEVSSAVTTTTSDIDAPTIQNRAIDSVVAINSGDTIILGGLIQDTKTNSEGGIPIIHKIPVLGKLFGRTSQDSNRTELLILITPRVVGNRNDAREITDEFRRKLQGITPIQKLPADKS